MVSTAPSQASVEPSSPRYTARTPSTMWVKGFTSAMVCSQPGAKTWGGGSPTGAGPEG